jgi:hypothetical protein
MRQYFHMDDKLFDEWTYQLIDKAYDWRELGISNDYCNKISEPNYGLRLINWSEQSFEIVDEYKYTIFLLRHR